MSWCQLAHQDLSGSILGVTRSRIPSRPGAVGAVSMMMRRKVGRALWKMMLQKTEITMVNAGIPEQEVGRD